MIPVPPQWWSTVHDGSFFYANWLIWCSTWFYFYCFQWGIFFQNNINFHLFGMWTSRRMQHRRKLQAKKPISASVDEIKKVRLNRFDWKKGDFILRPTVLRGFVELKWNSKRTARWMFMINHGSLQKQKSVRRHFIFTCFAWMVVLQKSPTRSSGSFLVQEQGIAWY